MNENSEKDMTVLQEELTDEELVHRILKGETFLFEIIMRRYNQRLFRITNGILKNGTEAEDVIQDAYVRAYEHLNQFAGDAKFSTWLTKIAIYEAFRRSKRSKRLTSIENFTKAEKIMNIFKGESDNPEKDFLRRRIVEMLESAINSLPAKYCVAVMLRDVEGLSTEETAECLGISEEAVKTRLHRGRSILRKELGDRAGITVKDLYPFAGERCDRIVANVLKRIKLSPSF
jgi:RNA polymerase sigma-70 factor, ECF subfamily